MYRANAHALVSYFAVRRWSRSFIGERFFVAASAAEAVHNFLNPHAKCLTPSEWKEVRCAIERALPAKHREKLLLKLSYLPSLTFAERIGSLISSLPSDFRQRIVGDDQQAARFVRRVTDLRNAKAHQLEHRTTGIELAGLFSKLCVLVDWALLRNIGLEVDQIVAAIDKCPEYSFYAYNQTWPWDTKEDQKQQAERADHQKTGGHLA